MKPLTQEAKDDLLEIIEYVEGGELKRGPYARFPLEWQYDHFQRLTDSYIFRDEDLTEYDREAYQKLVTFVDGVASRTCMFLNGDPLYDEDGQPLIEACHINTKAILECKMEGAMNLLDNISFLVF